MACRDQYILLKENCRDPSQLQDYKRGKLRRSRVKDGEFCVQIAIHDNKPLTLHQDFQDHAALFSLIKTCGKKKDLHTANLIHAYILERGILKKDLSLGNALLSLYVKCGALAKAQEIFNELPARNIVTWNALIAGYAQHGLGDKALICFQRMRDEGLSPNAITFICTLKACGSIGAAEKGAEIHAEVSRQGLLDNDNVLCTALIDLYAKCGALAKAQAVFDNVRARDVVMWNALIAGYAQHGLGDEALRCFKRMRDEGPSPNAVTFISILKACGSIRAAQMGQEIHAEMGKHGLLEKDIVIGTALMDMYAKCGMLDKAQEVFDKLPARNIVTWNALITGYTQHGLGDEVLNCFSQMQQEGLSPNAVTFLCILNACGSIGAAEKGEEIHAEVEKQGLLEKDTDLGNALVDMYAKCGALVKAQQVFDKLPARNVVTWNSIIAGYAQHELGDEALSCFGKMQDEGFSPDAVTFTCILKACASMGAVKKGEEIHGKVHRKGLLRKDMVLAKALVDMYVKCGELVKAQSVFDNLPMRNLATWTALIAGYTQVGNVKMVFDLFFRMIGEGLKPNVVTSVALLTACSHAGLVEEGQKYFEIMSTAYSIIPTLEHHICMVDIHSRAGHFETALSMFEKVPSSDCLLVWSALMGSCWKWVNVELGIWAFEHAVQLNEKFSGAYTCMSNIYASAGMSEGADEVQALRTKNRAWKVPGCCWWTDVSRNVNLFIVGDKSHPKRKCIYTKLRDIGKSLRLEGYSSEWVSQVISTDEEDVLCRHSEKLAIACALIDTPEATPIHVAKNTRVCGDCHFAITIISKMAKRKIQVIDATRIHIFEDGKCICDNNWWW